MNSRFDPQKSFKNAPKQPFLTGINSGGAGSSVELSGNEVWGSGTEQDERALAIYVHWPWCLKKCPYCDFNSHAAESYPREEYVAAICREIELWSQKAGHRGAISVFFGGGTPSLMLGAEVERILDTVARHFDLTADAEITAECNPTSASAKVLKDFRAAGINRISVGTQGLSAENLAFLGRQHNAADALQTLETAETLFKNVSADFIFGLPGQRLEEWLEQLERMTQMHLQHLSCYQLTVEPNTAFFSQVRRGEWAPLDADEQADFMHATRDLLMGAGYEPYEISNYAKPGFACRHNLHIWRYGEYLGVGAGAHGRIVVGNTRVATRVRKDPADYLTRMAKTNWALIEEEVIEPTSAWREAVMLGLRLAEGVDTKRLAQIIHTPLEQSGLDLGQMGHLRGVGLLWQQGSRWGATPEGVFLLDRMLEAIF